MPALWRSLSILSVNLSFSAIHAGHLAISLHMSVHVSLSAIHACPLAISIHIVCTSYIICDACLPFGDLPPHLCAFSPLCHPWPFVGSLFPTGVHLICGLHHIHLRPSVFHALNLQIYPRLLCTHVLNAIETVPKHVHFRTFLQTNLVVPRVFFKPICKSIYKKNIILAKRKHS